MEAVILLGIQRDISLLRLKSFKNQVYNYLFTEVIVIGITESLFKRYQHGNNS